MNSIKRGTFVYRKSQSKDVIFTVEKVINTKEKKTVLLKGVLERVLIESSIDDLVIADRKIIKEKLNYLDARINNRIEKSYYKNYQYNLSNNNRIQEKIITGKILHLDGDKKYSQKSYNYYKKVGLNAIIKNIPEFKQPKVVYNLLKIYKPDILIITGHDGMFNKDKNFNDLQNYRNSKYFINTVKEARRYDAETNSHLVIFAGACQSYFEGLILAGANFASSPGRILIDFLDPLIIAEKVATTEKYKYISIDDIAQELRDGKRGVDGIGASGKMYKKIIL